MRILLLVLVCGGLACLEPAAEDAGVLDSGLDAGDTGSDAGRQDAGGVDAGGSDAGDLDAGGDAGFPDAGSADSGADAGFDAGGSPPGSCANPFILPHGYEFDGGFETTFRVQPTDDRISLSCGDGGREYVYQFELTETQNIYVSMSAPAGTTVTASLVAGNCASTELGCSFGEGTTSLLGFAAQPPGIYTVIVELSGGAFADVTFRASRPLTVPPNDDCAGAIPIDLSSGFASVGGTTTLATRTIGVTDPSPSCVGTDTIGRPPGNGDVVFSYTLTQPQDVTITKRTPGFVKHWVRRSCASPALDDELFCRNVTSENTTTLQNQQPGTYFFWVSGRDLFFDFDFTLSPPTPPPANDLCVSPQRLFGDGGTAESLSATTRGASASFALSCAPTGLDVAFLIDVASTQRLEVEARPLPWDGGLLQPNLALRPAADCPPDGGLFDSGVSLLGCVRGFQMTQESRLTVSALPPGQYLLLVSGNNRTVGPFDLDAQLLPVASAPANDQCSGAQVLVLDGGVATARGTTFAATDDFTSTCQVQTASGEVQFTFTTPPVAATDAGFGAWVYVATENTRELIPEVSINAVCASAASRIECGWAGPGERDTTAFTGGIRLAPATTYNVSVGGARAPQPSGPFSLRLELGDQPSNDTCAGAIPLTLNVPVSGTLVGAMNDYARDAGYTGECLVDAPGAAADVAYSFTPQVTGGYLVTVTPREGTLAFPHVFEGACTSASVCRRATNVFVTGPVTTAFIGTAGSPVHIIVDGLFSTFWPSSQFQVVVSQ